MGRTGVSRLKDLFLGSMAHKLADKNQAHPHRDRGRQARLPVRF